MSILSAATGALVSDLWKAGAIAALAGMATSSAYLGYQWHAAAGDRDNAIAERGRAELARDTALSDNGQLRGAIASQNASILELARQSAAAQGRAAAALAALGPSKVGINALAGKLAAQPRSVTCEQALTRQRLAIDGLRAVPK